jgi:NAD(P)-dependent dehydrogenase (short-subunit alcohol dehydrogenase family)
MGDRVVWVSGSSSGLGRAAAAALKQSGWRVIAGARSFTGEEAEAEYGQALPLDVRDDASVRAFCDQAFALAGPPDALVNAAAILTLGPAEEIPLNELQAVMDTVLMGALRLTRAALPLMRRKGGGKIVMFSSLNGLMPTPFQGAYVSAKHALEGFSECLMLETRGQGIQVMLVEPGDHAGGSQRCRGKTKWVSPLYHHSLERVSGIIAKDEAQGQDPDRFGRRLARVMGRKRLPVRLRAATLKESFALIMHDVLPGRLFLRFLAGYYKV